MMVAHRVPDTVLTALFACLLLFIALRTLRQETRSKSSDAAPTPSTDDSRPCLLDPNTGRLCWTPRCGRILAASGAGRDVGRLEVPASREPVPVRLRLSAADRGDLQRRLGLHVETAGGTVALGELARAVESPEPQPILHKDLKPVVYVFGDAETQKALGDRAVSPLHDRLIFVKASLKTEDAKRFGVTQAPALVVVEKNEVLEKVEGRKTPKDLRAALLRALAKAQK
jgi:hypothetical protein